MKPTARFPQPGQYAGSSQGQPHGPMLYTVWKIGGVPMLIFASTDKAERDGVLAKLRGAAPNPERSGPAADAASKPDVAGSADAKLLGADHQPEGKPWNANHAADWFYGAGH